MKKFLNVLLLVIALCFVVGCGKKESKIDSVSTAKEYYNTTMTEFLNAKDVQAKFTFVTGDETQTVTVAYSFTEDNVTVLSSVLKDADGEVSVYVKDGKCYLSRYNNTKEYYELTSEEAQEIIDEYSFAAYVSKVKEIFSDSFFANSTIVSSSTTSAELNCDVTSLEIDPNTPEDEVEAAEEELDRIRLMVSVKLSIEVADKKMTKLVGTFVNNSDVTSTVTVEFISTSAPTVEVPNVSEYVAK